MRFFVAKNAPQNDRLQWLRWLWLSALVIVLDQLSKHAITGAFVLGEVREITSWFNLVLAHNTGAAFSFLADKPGWQRPFFTAVTVVITAVLLWMLRGHHRNRLLSGALALVIGGAMGNLIDRVRFGFVVDFIDWYLPNSSLPHWPAFNIADSAICLGATLLILESLRKPAAVTPEAAK